MSVSWDDLSDIVNKPEKIERENLVLFDITNLCFKYVIKAKENGFSEDLNRTIESIGKSYKAKRIICLADKSSSHYRRALYPEYKENRKNIKRTEEEQARLEIFFNNLNEAKKLLPFETYEYHGVEADDLIAYFALNLSHKYKHTWIISSDRDLHQLMADNISVFSWQTRKEFTPQTLMDERGLTIKEFILAKAIEGDSGDNVKGIDGIGPKRAAAIASEYHTLPNLLKALPIKGKSKYITNLNLGADILTRNDKLVNLVKYNLEALTATSERETIIQELTEALNAEI